MVLADARPLECAKLFSMASHPHPRQECRGSLLEQSRLLRETGDFSHGVDAELGGDVRPVEFHGALVDAEVGGDLFVEFAL